jgi:replicative DNA helicase Mcm
MQTQSQPPTDAGTSRADLSKDQFDELIAFFRDYYWDELGEFAQQYPKDTTTFPVDYADLEAGVSMPDLPGVEGFADRYLADPEVYDGHLADALNRVDIPVDVDVSDATVQVVNLPEWHTHYPGTFSPTDEAGHYRAIQGEISKATDVYSKLVEAAFECQRCGTLTRIRQAGEDFQEPHECQGCERQGPFNINVDQSEYIDAQALRVQTPPEIAQGAGTYIDVYVEGALADRAAVGDRVTITGLVRLEQVTSGIKKTAKFEPYLEGRHILLEESEQQDLDISPEERARIMALAEGEEGDPLEAAAESLAPKLYTDSKLDHIQRMCILAMVGGARVEYSDGDFDRGEFHMLLLGDPGTAKSKLIERVEELGWRTVGVSGKGATEAGVTASAEQDDFGDASEWTLSAGAFVKANGGLVAIDEIDDMPSDVRAAMLEPMSKQTVHISKAGINTKLQTQTAVVAAGNPKYGRFDPYEPLGEQFDLEKSLLSRFDLIFTLTDRPDEERDAKVIRQIAGARDAAKRQSRGLEVADEEADRIATPVDPEILRKWVALASRQPAPVFESDSVRDDLEESFTTLRAVNGYDEDAPVPVTFRKFEGIVRIAEAAAKLEFSDVITDRHARIATEAVGASMRDFGRDEEGNYDADIQETGESKSQRDKRQHIGELCKEIQGEHEDGMAPLEEIVEVAMEAGYGKNQTEHIVVEKGKNAGAFIEPKGDGRFKFLGWPA